MTAAIVGAWEAPGDAGGRSVSELSLEAAVAALADAGLAAPDVDGVLAAYSWEEPSMMFASHLADQLGVRAGYTETVCFGGCSPALMVARAARAIELGLCEVAVLTAASNRASGRGRAHAVAALRDVLSAEFEVPLGAFVPPVYALAARRHMHEFGTTPDQLAAIAATRRAHATLHPLAFKRTPIDVSDVLDSPMISSPLHLLDCCLVTDFAGAVVVASPRRVKTGHARPVWILGAGETHERITIGELASLTIRGAGVSAARALAQSGVGLRDLDFAQIYDSFTITVLISLEDIGFCRPGESGPRAADGAFAIGGELPVNTNGGMLSYRTGGMSHVLEAVAQLRGEAGERQVSGAELGLVTGIGGSLSTHCALVFGAEQR
jgi:acetyl-CoA acetyltransferase